jgi:ABC-type amino acid transport substrate-binding protein
MSASSPARRVAVLPGTTTEQELQRALSATRIDAEVLLVKTNQEGVAMVEKGQAAACFALALRRGDGDFRLAVDTALSHIHRQGQIVQVCKDAFGPLNTPSQLLAALYQISGLPD